MTASNLQPMVTCQRLCPDMADVYYLIVNAGLRSCVCPTAPHGPPFMGQKRFCTLQRFEHHLPAAEDGSGGPHRVPAATGCQRRPPPLPPPPPPLQG